MGQFAAILLLFLLPLFGLRPEKAVLTSVVDTPLPECLGAMWRQAAGVRMSDVQWLGDLPPANRYLALDRSVGRCRMPLLQGSGDADIRRG